jgi:glycosyltransferase involved in cell wall biosynthesis
MKIIGFSTLIFLARRVLELGAWRLVSIAARDVKRHGLRKTVTKAWRRLFWEQGASYLERAQQWYVRHGCDSIEEEAAQLFVLPHILIVGSLDLPQCKKYRVQQKVELLEGLNCRCQLADYRDALRVFEKMQLATLVLFYRVPDSLLFKHYLAEAHRLRLIVGYDIDDPIFDPNVYAENRNLDALSPVEKNQLLASAPSFRSAMKACVFVTVSSPGIHKLVASFFNRPIYLWRNVLDGETLAIVTGQMSGYITSRKKDERIVLCYMSGSRAHENDFITIERPLHDVLERYSQVDLLIGGYVTLPERLDPFRERIRQLPFVGYQGYFAGLAQADINLVPLLRDQFNECKSAIRFLESAALGIPTIASQVGDFANLVVSGQNGILCKEPDEWGKAMSELIESADRRRKIGNAARDYVFRYQTIDALRPHVHDTMAYMLRLPKGG